jgi:hypothetical protein
MESAMYFADSYPEMSANQQQNFAAAERRLMRRLIIMGCVSFVIVVGAFL